MIKDKQCNTKFPVWELGVTFWALWELGPVCYPTVASTRVMVPLMRSASEPYALLLARTTRERFSASWGLAETGAAGPTGNSYGDSPGHTCLAISGATEEVITLETGSTDRVANMRAFALAGLKLLQRHLSR